MSELLYGRNAVREALDGRRTATRLFVMRGTESHERVRALVGTARRRGVGVMMVSRPELERLVGAVNHQGVVLETEPYPYVDLNDLLVPGGPDAAPLLVLDHLQDPQNLGTLMRTAEAAGVAGIVVPERRASAITPAVVNASAGAVEHLRIAQVTNISRSLEQVKEGGYWAVAIEDVAGADVLFTADIPLPAALVVGSEGKGIAPTVLAHCDVVVRLPMFGRVGSLNAAVAGSIALYELVRRRSAR